MTHKTLKGCKALLRVIVRQPLLPGLQRASSFLVLWGTGYIAKAGLTRPEDLAREKYREWTCFGKSLEQV